MNLDLSGKNAIVCGSTQGLGYASAVELALLGANITLIARNEEKLKSVVQTLHCSSDQKHEYCVADFQFPEQVMVAITSYLTTHTTINILVNNTGGPAGGPALNASAEDYMRAFNSHLICNQILVQKLVPVMKTTGYGRIVNIISTSVKQPIPGLGVSNTIRGAVASWSKTLAGELGPFGITVNNVLPGYTRTNRFDYVIENKALQSGDTPAEVESKLAFEIPLRRIGTPEEFGSVVAFLCSPSAGYINGINLPVDGGRISCL